jgi:hypothetical protein
MLYQIPCTGDLLTTSGMPLALMVQPFSLPHPSEEHVQVLFLSFLAPRQMLHMFRKLFRPLIDFIGTTISTPVDFSKHFR